MASTLRVQLEDIFGNKLEPSFGFIESASGWQYAATMDIAGKWQFTMDARDPQVHLIENEVIARAYARIRQPQPGQYRWVEVGVGPINFIEEVIGQSNRITVGGDDLMRQLTYLSVHKLKLAEEGSYVPVATALSTLAGYAPLGWTIQYDPSDIISAPYPQTYARFNGETALAALSMVTQKAGCHFFRGTGKEILVRTTFADSEVFARQSEPRLNTAAILNLSRRRESYDIYTRIYPIGTGNGDIESTLWDTNRTAPEGYVLNKADNYIERIDSPFGTRHRRVEFREIGPIDNTDADLTAASNALFDAALQELQWHCEGILEPVYELELGNCDKLLRPMQSLHLAWKDGRIQIDQSLNILEARWSPGSQGRMQTTGLVVTTGNRWPRMSGDDAQYIADAITLGKVYRAIPQANGVAYWKSYKELVGQNRNEHYAQFPFRLGKEVRTIQRIYFAYKVEQAVDLTSISIGKVDVSLAIALDGSVTIPPHQHPVLAHQHPITISGGSSGTGPVGYIDVSPNTLLTKATPGSLIFVTDVDGGATLADDGGSGDVALEGSAGGEIDLSDAIQTYFSLNKMPILDTFDMEDLEVSVNGSDWVGLETGEAVGDGYFQLELTSHSVLNENHAFVMKDNFRPASETNTITVRRKESIYEAVIDNINNVSSATAGVLTLTPHGLTAGQTVVIEGNGDYDGVYFVDEVVSDTIFNIRTSVTGLQEGGTMTHIKMAQIRVELGVFVSIASILYED